MISVRQYILILMGGCLLIFYAIFWFNYHQMERKTSLLITQNIRSSLAEVSYFLSKELTDARDVRAYKAYLDRVAAQYDYIAAIQLAQGSHLILSTDLAHKQIPRRENVTLVSNKEPVDLTKVQAFEGEVRFFQQLEETRLRLFIVLDQHFIKRILNRSLSEIALTQGLPPLLIFAVLWFVLSKTVSWPLEQLRQFAYYKSWIPKITHLREFEAIRASMAQTYERLEQEKKELYALSTTDSLSGLANRNFLDQRLAWFISDASRSKKEFAVLFLDLDHFKEVNDSLGHKVGDMLLVEVAQELRHIVREHDVLARVGGDEFIIVLSQYAGHLELTGVAERIIERLAQPWIIDNYKLFISGSIGIALYPKDGADNTSLMKHADIAMFEAKKNGRNQYAFFTEEVNRQIQHAIMLGKEMKSAMANDEFELYYQPKVNTITGEIFAAEALIRWNHPRRGVVAPDQFIPIAEKNGFIVELGEWVIAQTIRQQLEWKNTLGIDIKLSANVSPLQFQDANFEPKLFNQIDESGVERDKIDLEITESLFLQNSDRNLQGIHHIHQKGITFSLDDFGTGYSSLGFLKSLPIDTLKIDKVFIQDYATTSGAIFLETIVKMAHSLRMKVICEGVETEQQLAYLKSIGCEYYQGYFCSRPVMATQFIDLLKQQNAGDKTASHNLRIVD
jgi:diguanylate cyclase (GGDEF)-like protein